MIQTTLALNGQRTIPAALHFSDKPTLHVQVEFRTLGVNRGVLVGPSTSLVPAALAALILHTRSTDHARLCL